MVKNKRSFIKLSKDDIEEIHYSAQNMDKGEKLIVIKAFSKRTICDVYAINKGCGEKCKAEIRITFYSGSDQCLIHSVDYEQAKKFISDVEFRIAGIIEDKFSDLL